MSVPPNEKVLELGKIKKKKIAQRRINENINLKKRRKPQMGSVYIKIPPKTYPYIHRQKRWGKVK